MLSGIDHHFSSYLVYIARLKTSTLLVLCNYMLSVSSNHIFYLLYFFITQAHLYTLEIIRMILNSIIYVPYITVTY